MTWRRSCGGTRERRATRHAVNQHIHDWQLELALFFSLEYAGEQLELALKNVLILQRGHNQSNIAAKLAAKFDFPKPVFINFGSRKHFLFVGCNELPYVSKLSCKFAVTRTNCHMRKSSQITTALCWCKQNGSERLTFEPEICSMPNIFRFHQRSVLHKDSSTYWDCQGKGERLKLKTQFTGPQSL